MIYNQIPSPNPFTINAETIAEFQSRYQWYINHIPQRMAIFTNAVVNSYNCSNWNADFSRESLVLLGEWFVRNIETRNLSEAEIKNKNSLVPEHLISAGVFSSRAITEQTLSIIVDISMYFGKTFTNLFPSLKWLLLTKGRKDSVDYGMPVIGYFGNDVLNPIHLMISSAWGVILGKKSGTVLVNLFDTWISYIV